MTNFERNALKFSEATRTASLLELWVRHLAEATPPLRARAHARQLATVEDAIIEHFRKSLSDADALAITHARDLRNKLLHCEFWTVKDLLTHAGTEFHVPDVTIIDLASGAQKPARDATAEDPRIYGWLWMGAAPNGLFDHADAAFSAAICVVKRLFSVSTTTEE